MSDDIQKIISKLQSDVKKKYEPNLIKLAESRRLEPGKTIEREWMKKNIKGLVEIEIESQANLSEVWNQGNPHEY